MIQTGQIYIQEKYLWDLIAVNMGKLLFQIIDDENGRLSQQKQKSFRIMNMLVPIRDEQEIV